MHLLCGAMPVRFTLKKNYNKKINSLHRRTAKLILPDHPLSTTAKLKKLDILPLQEQFVYNTAVLMFKVHMVWAPHYVCDLLNRAPAFFLAFFKTMSYRALAMTYTR